MKKRWPLLLLFLSTLFSPSTAGDTVTLSTSIRDGQTLISAGGNFELGFFSPGNSQNRYLGIWYKKIPVQTVVWVANRENPLTDSTGNLKIGNNGDLVIHNREAKILWSTNPSNLTSPVAQLLDSGNFVLTDGSNDSENFVWQSFDYPSDTLLPGMKLGWNVKVHLDRYLTTWKSTNDPSPGDYSFKMEFQGSPQVFIWHRLAKSYRNGPWTGFQFSGEPEMKSNNIFSFDFISNQDEVYYTYKILNSSIVSRFVLNQSVIQRYVWFDSKVAWSLYWSMPRDQCDYYAECGPNGVCNSNESPVCNCLKGFEPKLPQDWNMRDSSGGCVRRTGLDCLNGDGFQVMTGMKLPDTSQSTVDESISLDECRVRCLRNCSCMAFASANISAGGSGCVIWGRDLLDLKQYVEGGQDLYIRLAASELDSTRDNSNKKTQVIAIVVGVTIASGLLLLGSFGFYIWKKKLKSSGYKRSGRRRLPFDLLITHCSDDESSKGKDLELPLFDLVTVVFATNNFSSANKLGEGGFGAVYKGKLGGEQDIAVKRLSKNSMQ